MTRLPSKTERESGVQGRSAMPGVWGCPPQFLFLNLLAEQRESDAQRPSAGAGR